MSLAISLLSRFWPYLAGAALLTGAYFWIDHHGYQRGYADRDTIAVQQAEAARKKADTVNAKLADAAAAHASELQAGTDRTVERGRDLQTIVIREAANDPRYRSVECSTAGGVSDAILAAGRLSHRAEVDASSGFTVPARAPAE